MTWINQITPYTVRSNNWSATKLFETLLPGSIFVQEDKKPYFKEFFWHDLCSEFDSKHLYEELLKRKQSFSDEFWLFIEAWYRDEVNHAKGFGRIFTILFGESEESLADRLSQRPVDFSGFDEFFDDEFKLCVLFAYDEYATVLTYQKDSFYGQFGHAAFLEWIRRVRADETLHFINIVKLIHYKHPHRISETAAVLGTIITIEENLSSYKSTFLFDHNSPHFLLTPEELTTTCVEMVLKKITGTKASTKLGLVPPKEDRNPSWSELFCGDLL